MAEKNEKTLGSIENFSLVAGGPLYRIWRRIHLLKPPLDLLTLRTAVITLAVWLPLAALALNSGNVLKDVPVPFLFDLDVHVRFLVALPLLIAAEFFVHLKLRVIVRQFVNRGIVTPEERERFQQIVDSTLRWRDSAIAELAMIVLIWTLGHWVWEQRTSLVAATWYASREGDMIHYTPAGYWYVFASIPIFQFFVLRWYYRLAIWFRFLWKASRLNLKLIPTHPDKAGGLGFLSISAYAFAPVFVAHSIVWAGMIGNRIWHESASLLGFKQEIAGLVVVLLTLLFVPLMAFSLRLMEAKRIGLGDYGDLSQKYVRRFNEKWIRGEAPAAESLVGSPDIQSLADMANSFNIVTGMQPVPFGKETVLRMAILLVLPFLPLTLTIIPVDKILDKLVGVLL